MGVSLHERLRDYKTAIKYLELLLALPYVPHKRGHWWNRLALNLEHTNNKKKAFDTCQKGLGDRALSRACRLTLEQRLVRLGKSKHNWSGPAADSVVLSLKAPRSVLVQGSTRPGGVSGRKSAFVGYNGAPCGVEVLFSFRLVSITYQSLTGTRAAVLQTERWLARHAQRRRSVPRTVHAAVLGHYLQR